MKAVILAGGLGTRISEENPSGQSPWLKLAVSHLMACHENLLFHGINDLYLPGI